ncbi:MAG: sulfotransferase [Planctomycetota bacterium]
MSAPSSDPRGALEHRVFVVGVPRSGTTLVQGLLAAHPDAASFTESHFFSRHYRSLRRLKTSLLVRNPTERLRAFLSENQVEAHAEQPAFAELARRIDVRRPRLPFRSTEAAGLFLRFLDALAIARGRRHWIEKTPRHLHHLDFLDRISDRADLPQARLSFVHVIRRGLPTVASLRTASQSWERPYALEECVARWNKDLSRSLSRPTSDRDLFVSYEALTEKPEAVLCALLAQLGWSPKADLLDRFSRGTDALVTTEESWKKETGRSIQPSDSSGEALSEKERTWAEKHLQQDLYERALKRCVEARDA